MTDLDEKLEVQGEVRQEVMPKNVRLFGWISFFTDFSSEMIVPLLPSFLTGVLKASPLALGLIEGVAETIASFFKLFSGIWSDHLRKRRVFVVVGYIISSLMRVSIALAPHWAVVLFLRASDRVGKGLRTAPRDAMVSAAVTKNELGRAYGYHRMMDHAGAVFGSLVAALLIFLAPGDYRLIFAFAAIPALVACFLVFGVQEKNKRAPLLSIPAAKSDKRVHNRSRENTFFVLLFLFCLTNSADAFILLRLQNSGVPVMLLPVVWALFHVVKAAGNSFFGRASDHGLRSRFVFLGWLLYGVVYLLFSLPLSNVLAIILFLAYGLFFGLTESPEKALVSGFADDSAQGRVFGKYHFVQGMSLLPASVLFGAISTKLSEAMAFRMTGAAAIVCAALFLVWVRKR